MTKNKKSDSENKEYLVVRDIDKEKLDSLYKLAITRFASTMINEQPQPNTKPSVVAIGGTKEIDLVKLSPMDIEKFLWMHPVVPRGIEIKANRMIRRGYTIKPCILPGSNGPSDNAKRAAKEMKELIDNSGGVIRIKKWIEDSFGYGDGYMTLVPNESDTKIVKLSPEHPIFFRIARERREDVKSDVVSFQTSSQSSDIVFEYDGPMKIDPKTKKAAAFSQWIFSPDKKKFIPVGDELKADQVAHLTFDTWGDEVEGISLVQYLHLTIKYLLNSEEAGAESLVKAGFTQKAITTEIMNEKDLRRMAKNLTQINSKDAIILPKGSDVTNLLPGTSQFPEFHLVYLRLIAIRLGIPMPLLTMDGTSTNKATLDEQVKDMFADFGADEIQVQQKIEDEIFVPACRKLFGDEFIEFPVFEFNEFKESKSERINVKDVLSQSIKRLADSINVLSSAGYEGAADAITKILINEYIVEEFKDNEELREVSFRKSKSEGENKPEESEQKRDD
jgi:hypothetical protein